MKSPIARIEDLRGLKVTIMGLGLNGGGLASALFFARHGAAVTVTDMKSAEALEASVAALAEWPIRFVLGRHDMADFEDADLVIKNPAVKPDSPYLSAGVAVETDISVFLRLSNAPVIAITGSKGKSTVASAIHHGFIHAGKKAFLGGNITVSPLSFLDEIDSRSSVVLELSSWQLADLKGMGVLMPQVAVLTSMMPDHMNRYSSMEEYMADKRLIYADQNASCHLVANRDDEWNLSFASQTKARVSWYMDGPSAGLPGAWLEEGSGRGLFSPTGSLSDAEEILPVSLILPGRHNRKNLLGAALALRLSGLDPRATAAGMGSFRGVEHRLEFFAEKNGVRWFNDSAATIPQAVAAALSSFDTPLVLITGGTDKNLDFEPVKEAYRKPKDIVLLAGSGTEKLRPLLEGLGISYKGPFGDLESALRSALSKAVPGDTILLSPGCTSFGMFVHEFDRGLKFKETVKDIIGLS